MKQESADAIEKVERDTWNRSADIYMASAAELTSLAVPILIETAQLNTNSRALEVGCGPGHICQMMADTGAVVIGVDLAPDMVRVASSFQPNIEFKEANVEQLPFEDGTFDAVLVNYAIHHFARPTRACTEIHRILKSGGRFVFAGPLEQFAFGAFIEGLTAHHTMEDLPHGPIYMGAAAADYESLVVEAGFEEYDVKIRQLTLRLNSLEPLLQVGWVMCDLSQLPEETQSKIKATTIEKAAPYSVEGGYAFPDRLVVGYAVK